MIRSDLVWRVWRQNPHLLLRDVETFVDALFDEIIASLARGKRIELRGFEMFSIKVHEARTGRNPRTGALVPVPRRAHPHFKTGKEMKEWLNRREELTASLPCAVGRMNATRRGSMCATALFTLDRPNPIRPKPA